MSIDAVAAHWLLFDIDERVELTDPFDSESEKEENQGDEKNDYQIEFQFDQELPSEIDCPTKALKINQIRSHHLLEIPTPPPEK